jgi:hypothetical protein
MGVGMWRALGCGSVSNCDSEGVGAAEGVEGRRWGAEEMLG